MNPVTEIQNDISGLAALRDWLGDNGNPVHPMLAEMRASRCTAGNNGNPCPLNKAPLWWEKTKSAIANWVRRELEVKHAMELSVPQEDKLHMCAACGCCLPLKVWVPRDYLRSHTSKEALTKMPQFCWIRKEISDSVKS